MFIVTKGSAQTLPADTLIEDGKTYIYTPCIIEVQKPLPKFDSLAGFSVSKYLTENLKYPKMAIVDNVGGRVMVDFNINDDGSISNCKVSSSIYAACDNEALRLIRNMPAWRPIINNA